jgi:hypothetical protein
MTRGDDIDAACGQLVGQVADRTRRAEKWKQKIVEHQNSEKKISHSTSGQRQEILRTRGS